MERLIENLTNCIKAESCYLNYLDNASKLNDPEIQEILQNYHNCLEKYQEVKKYEPYIQIDEAKKALHDAKIELSKNATIQAYYDSYYILQERLSEITDIVFNQISVQLPIGQFKL